jgi:succinate dehydrogenase / fumarate reductase iron-sulfur subunit
MQQKQIIFRILRYKPGVIDPSRFQEFELTVDENMTVLDGLEKIRLAQDATLMYRHSCHHSSCGTCACKINGQARLACVTRVLALNSSAVVLEPLDGFQCLGDLVVDMRELFKDIDQGWSYVREAENVASEIRADGIDSFTRFENCIECGACVAACPVIDKNNGFMGPAALAALHREILKSPDRKSTLLALAGASRGEQLCERALNCSRVCPTGVYPARHIADLRRKLHPKTGS